MRVQVNAILRIVLIVSALLILASVWLFYISIRPPKIVSSITPRELNMPHEQVSFTTADGLTLRGWFIPSAKKADKTLILLHGYPADKGNILPALAFLHADFNLLLFDFRYLGESEGHYSTAGAKEVEDLLAAIRFLKRRGIKEVGVWGFFHGRRGRFDGDRQGSRDQSGCFGIELRESCRNGFAALQNAVARLSHGLSDRFLG
jgi:uncharacterized protein